MNSPTDAELRRAVVRWVKAHKNYDECEYRTWAALDTAQAMLLRLGTKLLARGKGG